MDGGDGDGRGQSHLRMQPAASLDGGGPYMHGRWRAAKERRRRVAKEKGEGREW